MNRDFAIPLVFVLLGLLAVLAFAPRARAQDHSPFHKDFYHHWKAPDNPNTSCCNARIEKDGKTVGDCEPTEARVRYGQWQAWIRQIGIWEPVPEAKIIRERNPNLVDGHVCWTQDRGIICFKPPDVGG